MSTKEDPATPGFWDVRYRGKRTPWDPAGTPPDLERYLAREGGGGRVLIPGCGSAYEVSAFSARGYEVAAIDFSAAAVERAQEMLGELQSAVVLGDFFSYEFGGAPFDVVYERAFLASLPRNLWPHYARRLRKLLRPGGRLVGFFVYGDQEGGPPYCLKSGQLAELLGEEFKKASEAVVATSVPVFEGRERWEVWTRKEPRQGSRLGMRPGPENGRG